MNKIVAMEFNPLPGSSLISIYFYIIRIDSQKTENVSTCNQSSQGSTGDDHYYLFLDYLRAPSFVSYLSAVSVYYVSQNMNTVLT